MIKAEEKITLVRVNDGKPGVDGYSPTVTTGTSEDGSTTVIITNKDGSTTTELVDWTARDDALTAQEATGALDDDLTQVKANE